MEEKVKNKKLEHQVDYMADQNEAFLCKVVAYDETFHELQIEKKNVEKEYKSICKLHKKTEIDN